MVGGRNTLKTTSPKKTFEEGNRPPFPTCKKISRRKQVHVNPLLFYFSLLRSFDSMYNFFIRETETKDKTNIEGPSNAPEAKKEEEPQKKKLTLFTICTIANFKVTLICHIFFRIKNMIQILK